MINKLEDPGPETIIFSNKLLFHLKNQITGIVKKP